MKHILLTLLLHPSRYNYGKAIKLTKEILKKRGYEHLPCDLSFKRYAERDNLKDMILNRYNIPLIRFKTNGSDEKATLLETINKIIYN